MIYETFRIVFPEGDTQEIPHQLKVRQIVDLNGYPLGLPLASPRVIAFEVYKIRTHMTRNEKITDYHLELLDRNELEEYTKNRMSQYR